MTMRRGDLVRVAAPGDYGKPRPAVVVQTDALNASGLGSVVVCLLTSTVADAPLFRIQIEPSKGNGLDRVSWIMVEKILTVRRERIGKVIGHLDDATVLKLNRTLAFVLGLGG